MHLSRLSLGVQRPGTRPKGAGSQSFSTFSNRLPPNKPTGIKTQNRAAVPKISEAMIDEEGCYLSSSSSCQFLGHGKNRLPWRITPQVSCHHAAGSGPVTPLLQASQQILQGNLGQPELTGDQRVRPTPGWRPLVPLQSAQQQSTLSRKAGGNGSGLLCHRFQSWTVLKGPNPERAAHGPP